VRLAPIAFTIFTMPGPVATAAYLPPPAAPVEVARFGRNVALRVPDDLGDGFLLLPPQCRVQECPLIIASHRRGGRAADGLDDTRHGPYHRFLMRFVQAGFPVLLSEDGGPHTWGSPRALDNTERLWAKATGLFEFDGVTFTLGTSMGGLPATLLGMTGRLAVRATILVDARLNLGEAFRSSDQSRVREIGSAFGFTLPGDFRLSAAAHDPVNPLAGFVVRPATTLAFASPEDQTVPLETNSGLFVDLAGQHDARSTLHFTRGPHLGGSHLSEEVAETAVSFLHEMRARPTFP
jgi:hypothetical protein